MAPVPSPGYLDRFRAALISEIKAEMGRRDLTNAALAALIGESKQYVGSRLGAGNPHTGRRVEVNVPDLYVIAGALDLDPRVLLDRAQAAANDDEGGGSVTTIKPKRPPAAIVKSDPDATLAIAADESGPSIAGEQEGRNEP